MPVKVMSVPEVGNVHFYKRRGARVIRLSITQEGSVRVTLPSWAPYAAGVQFVRSKSSWIASNKPAEPAGLAQKDRVGKYHQLVFISDAATDKIGTRIAAREVRVTYPPRYTRDHPEVQQAARRGGVRALRREAENLLPQRLALLAREHGFAYRSVGVKQLKTRWGSCDSSQNITLNLFLMQLPWPLIDYVLIHELVHTRHMDHGPGFWSEFERCLPGAKRVRKQLRTYRTMLNAQT